MDVNRLADECEAYVIEQRRWFDQYPEVAWEEVQTTIAIEERLRDIGLEPARFEDISGVYCEIRGGKRGPGSKTLLLRADIDGVILREETGLPFASVNRGLMHATGRDCHIAMMLGAARILYRLRDELEGDVRLLFQGAEESAQGALEYIRRGIMDGVDAVYASHVYGGLEAFQTDVTPGHRMASADKFSIEIFGRSAYGSLPHLGKDAIVAAAGVIFDVQSYVSRNSNPLYPLAVTIGTIQGGTQRNIIAGHVRMEGTVRTHSAEIREKIEGELRNIIEHSAAAHGCGARLEYHYMLPPLVNDKALSRIAARAAERLRPAGDVLTGMPPVMSSEDFACYGGHAPCVYVNLGCTNRQLGYVENNYSSKFTVDEGVLRYGTALCVQFTVDYLKEMRGIHGQETELLQ